MEKKPIGKIKYIFTAISILISLLVWQFISSSVA